MRPRDLDKIKDWPTDDILFGEAWNHRFMKGGKSCPTYKNCYWGFGNIFQVKMFIGGQQRVLGESFTAQHAVRFADMALVYFSKYRRRSRAIADDDVNFTLETAKHDLLVMTDAKAILVEMEEKLIKGGLIAETSRDLKDRRTPQQVRKDMRLHFRQFRSDTDRIAALLVNEPNAHIALGMMSENIDVIVKLNEHLDNQLFKLEQPNTTEQQQPNRIAVSPCP
jgi:hypothetical protein